MTMPVWLFIGLLILAALFGFLCAMSAFIDAIAYYRRHERESKLEPNRDN